MSLQTDALANVQMRRTILVPARVLLKITETLFNETVVEVERNDFKGGADFDVFRIPNTEFLFTVKVYEDRAEFKVLDIQGDIIGSGTSHVELIEFLQNQGADICDEFIVSLLSNQ